MLVIRLPLHNLLTDQSVLVLLSHGKVGDLVIALNLESFVSVGLDHCDIVLFGNFDLNADRILRLSVVIAGEVNSDDALHMLLVLLVLAQEVLYVLVLREGELRER